MDNINHIHNLPDTEKWEALKNGDQVIYSYLIHEYTPILYNYGKKILNDQGIVEDAIQDLFVEIWEKKQRLGNVEHIKFYLISSLRRRLLRKINKAESTSLDPVDDDFNFRLEWSHEAQLIEKQKTGEKSDLLAKSIEKLPERQKEAIYLKFYENFSYEEIASSMEISVNAVYKAVSKAMKILRENLSNIGVFMYLPNLIFFIIL